MEPALPLIADGPGQIPMIPPPRQDTTLYVGNLHPSMSDEDLYHEFNVYPNLAAWRVMKNAYTKESRCFGFVTFNDLASAQRAQRETNAKEVWKRELRVHFKKNTKNLNRDANFIIKNIAKNITSKQLNEECAKFGEIISCFVRRDEESDRPTSLGYGYVQFEKTEDGQRFLSDFNGRELNGQKVTVEKFIPQKARAHNEAQNVYIKSFPESWTQEKIDEFVSREFAKFGEIVSKGVFKYEKLHSFYAFVAYKDSASGVQAIKELNNLDIDGAKLYVSPAMSKSKRRFMLKQERNNNNQPTNLYVRSIKMTVDEDAFKAAFEKFGKVTSVCLREWKPPARDSLPSVPATAPAQPMKFGFINFQTPEQAQEALLNSKKDADIRALVNVEGDASFVFVAQSKETRAQYLSMQKRMKDSMRHNIPYGYQPMKAQRARGPRNQIMGMPGMMPGIGPIPGMLPGIAPFPPGTYPMIPSMLPVPPGQMSGFPGALPAMMPTGPMARAPVQPGRVPAAQDASQGPPDYKKIADDLRKSQKEFQSKSTDEQKNLLGNIMYQRVRSVQKDDNLIPKITGMLIDTEVLEFDEILEIIENDAALKERIEEAIEVINENTENKDDKADN